MPIDLLDTPLRVSWDLHDENGPTPSAAARHIAGELVAAGVFFVTLDRSPLLHPEIGNICRILASGGCRALVVSRGTAAELAVLSRTSPIDSLLLDLEPFLAAGRIRFSALREVLEAIRQAALEPAFLLVPNRFNLPLLPDLLGFCRQAGVARFKLPNTRIDDNYEPLPPASRLRAEDIATFRERLQGDPLSLPAGVTLEVHDLFLWEILFPGRQEGRSEYGGCQAANSLGHIDAGGDLHPCSSWAQRLGSLRQHALADLWQSPLRHAIRSEIAAPPTGCQGCRDYSLCFGGCRGLGRAYNREGGGRDPLCRSPRG